MVYYGMDQSERWHVVVKEYPTTKEVNVGNGVWFRIFEDDNPGVYLHFTPDGVTWLSSTDERRHKYAKMFFSGLWKVRDLCRNGKFPVSIDRLKEVFGEGESRAGTFLVNVFSCYGHSELITSQLEMEAHGPRVVINFAGFVELDDDDVLVQMLRMGSVNS